jgi:elongation factor P
MLSMNELKPGVIIELDGEPYIVLESNHNKVAQRRPVMQTKIRNVITGKVRAETFQQSDSIREADIERLKAKFIYRTKNEFFFQTDSGEKISFKEDMLENKTGFLKKDMAVDIFSFKEKPISIELPIKIILEVKEAPPGHRGDTVQGGLKDVVLETGTVVKTPLFIETGDKIEIDTRTGSYTRRANE